MSIRVVSLFSGGGGLDLGFIQEGFDIVWAVDNMRSAVDTYKHNIGDHIVCADINTVDLKTIPRCDIVVGGPPCQSFSLIGKRQTEDDRGRLVWRYMDIIKTLKPKMFMFENVVGLLSAKNSEGKKILDLLVEEFSSIGYTVTHKVVNAADYGVPQHRKRVIIVGVKGKAKFEFPTETHGDGRKEKHVSAKDALSDLGELSTGQAAYIHLPKTAFQKNIRGTSKRTSGHSAFTLSELDKYIIKHVKPGGNYMDVPKSVNSKRIRRLQETGGHTTCYGRLSPSKPSYTINTYFNRPNVGCNIHYDQARLITIREALRLQSFPDNYDLIAKSTRDKCTIVGNAVPPIMARAIAKQIRKHLETV